MRALLLSAAGAFAVDQISKIAVVHWLDLKHLLVMPVAPPFLVFRMGWNAGMNFGLLSGAEARWILIALAVVVSVVLIWWARGFTRTRARVAAGLIVGGALANAFDRVLYGAVADFLNMSCCGIENPFAFNLADVFIFAGAAGLVLWGEDRPRAAKTP
ncbi:Lipoprotein signal peptidase [Jannaschia seosinensis]|uniref:Lipoprotein signal peptidase n=1 Tax=Jannaschia seosinensis TaxID=313367 RepID=A0A0M7B8I5_9RHOB|nr:signal peptidase II [Jannaschia seosinensis]CUH16078.1 Lipoprotein signal peptidase [Jannaschia seosinensis]